MSLVKFISCHTTFKATTCKKNIIEKSTVFRNKIGVTKDIIISPSNISLYKNNSVELKALKLAALS